MNFNINRTHLTVGTLNSNDMVKEDNNKSKIDALTDNMISSIKRHEDLDKKFVRRIRLMPEIKKKYEFVAKDEKSVESEYFCAGFVEGADWRINSVWHDVEESPKQGSLIAVFDGKDMHLWRAEDIVNVINGIRVVSITVNECFIRQHIIKWAYVKDLIPNAED